MRRDRKIPQRDMPVLHPAITHINATPGFFKNHEMIGLVNQMAEIAYHMKKTDFSHPALDGDSETNNPIERI